jgi:signal transduction histidine kinase
MQASQARIRGSESVSESMMQRIRIPHFLDVATYVSVAAMSVLGISGLSSLRLRLLALGLVLIFGLLYHFVFRSGRYERSPNLYFGFQAVTLGLLFLLGSDNSDAFNFLFVILAVHIAAVSTPRVAAVWIAACFIVLSLIMLATRGADGVYAVLFYSVTFIVGGFFGYTIQQAESARDRNQQLVEELQAAQQRLREAAVIEERNRLARELHDSVKQQVFAIVMQLGAARTLLNEETEAYGPVDEAERLARQAGAELTTLIRELRPPDLERKTLAEALHEYINAWSRQNGIGANFKTDGVSSIPLAGDETLFRVTQEALANVARHSQAHYVTVKLAHRDDNIMLIVEDDGTGFDPGRVEEGIGLNSMRERLSAIGGQLDISSHEARGTTVAAKLRRS